MSDAPFVESADTEQVLSALSDSIRLDILAALWESDRETVPFSALRDAVGVSDSGKFNYHLDKLTDRFVRKTDDGYELTLAGRNINGAILAGSYTKGGTMDPITLGESCPVCGDRWTLHYENEVVTVSCNSCDHVSRAGVPPGVFEGYDREEIPAVASRYFRVICEQIASGFCWYCQGRTDPTVTADGTDEREAEPGDSEQLPVVRYDCRRCHQDLWIDLANALVTHPAVVTFYHDHDVVAREIPPWRFAVFDPERYRITDRDPLRARVSYTCDDDRLALAVDETLEVRSVERSAG